MDGGARKVRSGPLVPSPSQDDRCLSRSTTDQSVEACKKFTAEVTQFVREQNAELSGHDLGWFLNLCQGDEKPEDVFGSNLPRLRRIKAKYDPKKMFRKGVVIEPLL